VSILILLVLVAVAWIVVLAPGLLRRIRDRHRVGSIDHFHHQLQLLEHAGPKLVPPAYRLHTALPGARVRGSLPPVAGASSRPNLVLVRPVHDARSADIEGADGAHYERVGVIEAPESPVSRAHTHAELGAYRRQQARRRCTVLLRLLMAVTAITGLLGLLPSLHMAWIVTGLTGVTALAVVGLIAYAQEVEGHRRSRPIAHLAHHYEDPHTDAARAGYPGGWDDDDAQPRQAAAGR
jgi:hypothetical protein